MSESQALVQVRNYQQRRVMLRRVLPKAQPTDALVYADCLIEQGMNNVDAAELAAFRALPTNEQFFRDLWLEVVGDVPTATVDAPAKSGGDLAKIKLVNALKLIAGEKSLTQLKRWIDQDGRPEIRAALLKRYEELQKGTEDDGVKEI